MLQSAIGGAEFSALLAGGLASLKASADEINELNVFPIPDGDTGDNMVSTLSGGARLAKSCSGGDHFTAIHPGVSWQDQLTQGEKIGLGSRSYTLKEI